MAHLEAELARFEAELAGAPGQPAPRILPSPPGGFRPPSAFNPPQAAGSSGPLPPPPEASYAAPPQAVPLPRPAFLPPPPPVAQQAAYPAYAYQPPAQSYPSQQAAAAPYYAAAAAPAAAAPTYARPAQDVYAAAAAPAYAYASAAGTAARAHPADALAGVKAALEKEASESKGAKKARPPALPRAAGGEKWWDASLLEWPENDFRIFVGDLGNEVNDDVLTKSFQKYGSFAKAKVVRDKRSNKSKGFGFVSFMDPIEGAKALREMDGKYVGNRPCKLRKSNWEERTNEVALNKKRKLPPGAKAPLNMKKHVGVLHR